LARPVGSGFPGWSLVPSIAGHWGPTLRVLDFLLEEVEQFDQEITRRAREDARVKLLTTMPGIGKCSAPLIVAEIGHAQRFPNAKHLASYAGLVPSAHSSGGTTHYGHITNEGLAWLRWIMVQAAHVAARQPGRWQEFYWKVARRRGKSTATIALARKMLTVCYYLLKRGEGFREGGNR